MKFIIFKRTQSDQTNYCTSFPACTHMHTHTTHHTHAHTHTHTHTHAHTHTHTHTHTQEVSLASCQEENKHLSKQSQDLERMLTAKEAKLEELARSVEELKGSLSQQEKEKAGLIAKVTW